MKGAGASLGIALRTLVALGVLALIGYWATNWAPPPAEKGKAAPVENERAPGAEAKAAEAAAPEEQVQPDASAVEKGLYFPKTLVPVTVAADAADAVVDFHFENRAQQTLTIREVEKDCDCADVLISNGKLSYAPGEKGVIRANFRLENLIGEVDKNFLLFMEGDRPDQPGFKLTARIRIPDVLELSARTVDWMVGAASEPRKVDVRIVHDQPVRILNAVSSRDDLRATVKELEPGRHYELWLEPSAVEQTGLALVRLETDCPIPRWKLVQVFVRFLNSVPPPP